MLVVPLVALFRHQQWIGGQARVAVVRRWRDTPREDEWGQIGSIGGRHGLEILTGMGTNLKPSGIDAASPSACVKQRSFRTMLAGQTYQDADV